MSFFSNSYSIEKITIIENRKYNCQIQWINTLSEKFCGFMKWLPLEENGQFYSTLPRALAFSWLGYRLILDLIKTLSWIAVESNSFTMLIWIHFNMRSPCIRISRDNTCHGGTSIASAEYTYIIYYSLYVIRFSI